MATLNEKDVKGERDLEHSSSSSSSTIVGDQAEINEKQNNHAVSPRWKRFIPFVPYYPQIPDPPESMDTAKEIPLAKANFISTITFWWITPMLSLGNKRPLQAPDLWKLDRSRQVEFLADEFLASFRKRQADAAVWNRKIKSGEIKPNFFQKHVTYPFKNKLGIQKKDGTYEAGLFMALNDILGFKFWTAGLLKVAADSLTVTTPLVTKIIINFGSSAYYSRRGVPGFEAEPIGRGVGAAVGLLCMLLTASLLLHQFFSRSMECGVLARGTLISAIYRQSMTMSGKARAEIPNGKLVSHISTDVSRIDFATGFAHMSWTSFVQLGIVIAILIVQIGPSALVGVGFMFVCMPIQLWAMKTMFKVRGKTGKFTDQRAKLTQELLGGMKIIKFFAWEGPYLKKLLGVRSEELARLRKLLIIRAATMAFAMSLPVLASVLAFVTFYQVGGGPTAANIFTSLTLFNLLRMPLMMLPVGLSTVTDAMAALKRLRPIFTSEKIGEAFVVEPDNKYAVEVKDGDFMWEGAPPEILSKKEQKKKDAKDAKAVKRKSKIEGHSDAKMPIVTDQAKLTQEAETRDAMEPIESDAMQEPGQVPAVIPGSQTATFEEKVETLQLRDVNISIPRGQLVGIVGPVGSGKSSFLNALIGEMKQMKGSVTFGGSVGYCAQSAWIQNATLKDNIVFGQAWNEERYNAAVRDACLEPDLAILPDGDMTEIGEKGINLSGGQRQRVGIARALYFDADIVALDDPLSAVDAHVGKYLFEHAIKGSLAGKTRLLVTHALHFLPEVDYIYCIEQGQIMEHGTYTDLMSRKGAFFNLLEEFGGAAEEKREVDEEKQEAAVEEAVEQDLADNKAKAVEKKPKAAALMQQEERATGAVTWKVVGAFIRAAHGVYMVPLLLIVICLMQGAQVTSGYWLVWWQQNQFNQSVGFYMAMYAVLGVLQAIFSFLMGLTACLMGYNASKGLHNAAFARVLRAPMSMFDTTPIGRIMNRFSKDVDTVDNTLNDSMRMALSTLGQVAGSIILIAIVNQYFLIAVVGILFIYFKFAQYYRKSAREIKRLDNLLRSSLYAHFSESLSGLATIRAYREQDRFLKHNDEMVDTENRAYLLTIYNQRWLGLRLDMLGGLLSFVVAIIAVTERYNISPSEIGLILSYILSVQMSFSWMVRQLAEVENDMNSVERLLHYANEVDQEAPSEIVDSKPPANWPKEGAVSFNKVVMSYRPGLPAVLKGMSLQVRPGEKIGIIGRTGAGKSSLMTTLLRIVELTSGNITVDGIDIAKIGLDDLRQAIGIIPQEALLFNGTIRSNLDPFGLYEDARLWDALKRSWLVDGDLERKVADGPAKNRFTLDTVIEDEGQNLSVGERSLVSLARALVKDSRIVILDEATASVDFATDSKIQETIRTEFKDKTLLCIAHRLMTIINYDRVLVMDQGNVAEFDTPANLFAQGGIFNTMCERSNISMEDIKRAQGDRALPPKAIEA